MPTVAVVDTQQTGASYRVQLIAEIARDVLPTDDLAIIVSVDGHEVGRYPIIGRFENRKTLVKQEIELPLGDYDIEYDYKGTRFSGMPFRLADVPTWGGRRAIQVRPHPGTRVSLREKKLWVGRWWANDGPARAWIIEWAYEGQVVTTTSGWEQRGIPGDAMRVVGGAAGAFASPTVVENTVWAYGEEYPLPDVVVTKPGPWAARVVHGGSNPVSIVFNVLPGGRLKEASNRKVYSAGWEESWSERLEQRALSVTEVDRLTGKLPAVDSSRPFDEPTASKGPESPVRISVAAVRALFRSKALAEAWWQFANLNVAARTENASRGGQPIDVAAFRKDQKKPGTLAQKQAAANAKAAAKEEADRRSKLRTLRTEIEKLIKAHGGPWKSDEFPRS
jgi:hypothetical protein